MISERVTLTVAAKACQASHASDFCKAGQARARHPSALPEHPKDARRRAVVARRAAQQIARGPRVLDCSRAASVGRDYGKNRCFPTLLVNVAKISGTKLEQAVSKRATVREVTDLQQLPAARGNA